MLTPWVWGLRMLSKFASGWARLLAASACTVLFTSGCNRKVPSATDPELDPAVVPIPAGLSAIVGDGRVQLTWSVLAADSAQVSTFIVYRIDSLNAAPRRLDSLPWPPFVDSTALNGTLYAYAVSVRNLDGIEGLRSVAIKAQPRFVSLRINDDSLFTRSTDVRLAITATGATLMRLANDTAQPANWRSFSTSVPWSLLTNAGPKGVFAQFQFSDGAQFDGWVGDSITLDDRAQIQSITLSDSLLAPGDSLVVILKAQETQGTATFDLGGRSGIRLFDDGNPPDVSAQDGIYSAAYIAGVGDLFEQAPLEGHFTDRAGNRAPDVTAAWRVSVRQAPVPPAWIDIVAVPGDPTSLNLSWVRVSSESFSQLQLRRSTVAGSGVNAPIVALFNSASVTQYRDTGLVGSTNYYYSLELVLTNGLSALSAEATGRTPVDVAPSPVTVAVTPTADSSLLLTWTQSTAADFESYRVYRGLTSATLNPSPPADSLLVSVITTVGTATYSESGQSQYFYYRVFVFDRGGQRSGSNIVWGPKDFGP